MQLQAEADVAAFVRRDEQQVTCSPIISHVPRHLPHPQLFSYLLMCTHGQVKSGPAFYKAPGSSLVAVMVSTVGIYRNL